MEGYQHNFIFTQYLGATSKDAREVVNDLKCSIKVGRVIFAFDARKEVVGFVTWSKICKHTARSVVKSSFWPSMFWEKDAGYITFIEHIYFERDVILSEKKRIFRKIITSQKCVLLLHNRCFSLWIYGKKIVTKGVLGVLST